MNMLSYIVIYYHIIIYCYILSYIVKYYHILSYIVIYYHILSYIIIYYHILSLLSLSPAHPRSEPDFHGLQKSFQIQETKVEAAGGLEKKPLDEFYTCFFLVTPGHQDT